MIFLIVWTLLITIAYCSLIGSIYFSWTHSPKTELYSHLSDCKLSVVIVSRNEESNIQACLSSISRNSLPVELYEIILVDDHSEDKTVKMARALQISNLKIIKISDYDHSSYGTSFKKAGLYYGIQKAENKIIVTTDSDCICPVEWLSTITSYFHQYDIDMTTGPIVIRESSSWLTNFQSIEMAGIMAGTMAGIKNGLYHSGNGANMAYYKSLYEEYSKYQDTTTASGDDVFLIQWAVKEGKKVHFIKSKKAIIETKAVPKFQEFVLQRIRWSSKTTYYQDIGMIFFMATVFFFHATLIFFGIVLLSNFNFFLYFFCLMVFIKVITDYLVLKKVTKFFGLSYSFGSGLILSLLHTVYILLFGVMGLIKTNYIWKGRLVR